ncbi:MAG: serine/threonine-protein kinase [Planctomycetota bacterium]
MLDTALAKEQDRRYQTALDLAEDLRRVRQRLPILARPPGPVGRLSRWARRNPAVAVTVAAVVLALSAGLVVTGSLLGRTRASLAEVRRLTDSQMLEYLERAAAAELWPVLPESIPAMNRWLEEAEAFSGRAQASGRDLSDLSATIENVRRRHREASRIDERTVGAPAAAWQAVIEAIADERRSPQYRGLRIEPQVGLVPVGQDPDSGLFEFAHLQTGEPPARDPVTGRFPVAGEAPGVSACCPPSVRGLE